MEQFLTGQYLVRISQGVFALILFSAAWHYFVGGRFLKYKTLVRNAIWFRVLYALALTVGQYYLWAQSPFSKPLLNTPLSESLPIPLIKAFPQIFNTRIGYFLFYSWGHFWINLVLALFLAWLFYKFLLLLKKHQDRFFEEGEVRLGFVCALVAGWPGIIVFVPLTFIFVVLLSIIRAVTLSERYTTLGVPFLLAAATALWMSQQILSYFQLWLRI
ncbi:MAG: hypothetical protein Q7R98_00715 [Candidatus Jorgensenbacteria bacterium]|nr:hypothetical protein [Candidatus Jorgensenbacteria bacterium]